MTRVSCGNCNDVSCYSDRCYVFELPRSRCARKGSREPHPRHTWHAKQMLAEQMLGPAIFGKCFANIHFDLKFQSFQQCNNKVGLINSPANRILSCKKGAVVVGRLRLGWKEMIVLPLMFRMRWTDNRSKTSNRLSLEVTLIWGQLGNRVRGSSLE